MLQGTAAAGVVGVTVLTLPTAAMSGSYGPTPDPSTTAPSATTSEAPGAPDGPTDIVAIPGAGVINVSWTAATGATSYQVYYKLTSDDDTSWVPFGAPVAASPVEVTGLGPTASHDFYVAALNGTTSSAPSDIASATLASGVGATWTSQSTAGANLNWRSVTYGNGVFAAAAQSGSGSPAMTSRDGSTWVLRNTPADNGWLPVTHGMIDSSTTATPSGTLIPGFVAIGQLGPGMTSTDYAVWTAGSIPANNDEFWQAGTYGNGLFVAVSSLGNVRVAISTDGITWVSQTQASNNFRTSVTYDNGKVVAVSLDGANNCVMASP